MNDKDFDVLVKRRIALIQKTLIRKGKEYASADDRLYNFKRSAEIGRDTPKKAWFGKFRKHLVSVIDLIEDRLNPTKELIDEKIGDSVNYLILLEAILIEELECTPCLECPECYEDTQLINE